MVRSLDDAIESPSQDKREKSDPSDARPAPYVKGLRALRRIAGKAQADVAAALNIKQPSVSKIEKQADMHISTLRSYVEAVGGELELTVRLPERPAVRIHDLGDTAVQVSEGFSGQAAPFTKTGGAR